ncbi:MAG: hypothetical protein OXF08_04235 [Bacteroidetes bacterium]|nr:hypothetical protein [Bacteroidota bacterium]
MKIIYRLGLVALLAYLIIFSACENPSEEGVDTKLPEEIAKLAERYITEDALLLIGQGALELVEYASVSGRTSSNVPYVQLTGQNATAFILGNELGKTNEEPYSCTLDSGSGTRAQIRFGRCVLDLLNRGICVHGSKLDNGDIYVRPTTC